MLVKLVVRDRIELSTFRFSGGRSYRLSYLTWLMSKLINACNQSATVPEQVLPHARLHDLRHLHATTLLLAGVPVHVVAARLGHADPDDARRKSPELLGGIPHSVRP